MTKKFVFSASTGFYGSERKDVIEMEFKDNATEDQIEKEVQEQFDIWLYNHCDIGWYEAEEEDEVTY